MDHIVWKQFKPFLHEKGLVVTPAKKFLAHPWKGYLLLVNKKQRDDILSEDFIVASHLPAELLLVDLRQQGWILEIYTLLDGDEDKSFLHLIPADDDGIFVVDDDTFFIPICYHDNKTD